jgi:hypothetical protein
MNLSTTATGNETIKPAKNKRKQVRAVVAEEDSSENEDGNGSHACERIM